MPLWLELLFLLWYAIGIIALLHAAAIQPIIQGRGFIPYILNVAAILLWPILFVIWVLVKLISSR